MTEVFTRNHKLIKQLWRCTTLSSHVFSVCLGWWAAPQQWDPWQGSAMSERGREGRGDRDEQGNKSPRDLFPPSRSQYCIQGETSPLAYHLPSLHILYLYSGFFLSSGPPVVTLVGSNIALICSTHLRCRVQRQDAPHTSDFGAEKITVMSHCGKKSSVHSIVAEREDTQFTHWAIAP